MAGPLLFALDASRGLGERVAHALGTPLTTHEERRFEDGEHKSRPLANVRERDVYVLQSLHGADVDARLVRLLFFVGGLKQSGAARVTAVVPYLAYSRNERRTEPNDPVTSRYLAALFEAVGTDRIVTVDVHNLAAYQNAFRCRTEQLEARHRLVGPVAAALGSDHAVVLSPDVGGVKRAERFRETLVAWLGRPVDNGFMEKHRFDTRVSGERVVGEVRDATVVIVDDLIASGTTLARAAAACRGAGAGRVLAVATHGLFTAGAAERLAAAPIERVWVTDTVERQGPVGGALPPRVEVVGLAPFLAEAIGRLHGGELLSEMTEES